MLQLSRASIVIRVIAKRYLTAQNVLQAITVEATFWMQSYLRSSYSSDLNWKPSWTRAEELGIIVPDSVSMTVLSNGQPIERADGTATYLREDSGVYPTMKKKWYLPNMMRMEKRLTMVRFPSATRRIRKKVRSAENMCRR